MSFNNTMIDALLDHAGTLALYVSLHSADPGTTGTNETTAGRQAASWAVAATGSKQLSAADSFTGGAANGAVTWVGLWSAATGGTFYGGFQITTGDTAFNASGQYTLDDLTITGS